jgi:hypothetical protein
MTTGGELNELNGKYGISAPAKSVPIMKLIKAHKPKTQTELVDLVEIHFIDKTCACGVISQGTIEDFGENLYEAQSKEWGKYKYTLDDCKKWEYELFISNSIKGGVLEKKAIDLLTISNTNYQFEESDNYLDEEYRIDIVIKDNSNIIAGIQVKPETYKTMRYGVIHRNIASNQKWGKPVFYLYYDDQGNFTNITDVESEISKL